jgi:hypothetical protein
MGENLGQETSLLPNLSTSLEGSLFASEITQNVVELHEELLQNGHFLGLSRTTQPERDVFFRAGRREVIGAEAIRRHFNIVA